MVDGFLSGWLSKPPRELDQLLKVPFDYQPEAEDECVIYCLWMVIHYFKNKHPSSELRNQTNALSPDDILEHMTIVEGGWKPDQDELTLVSERTKTLHFDVRDWQDSAPKALFQMICEDINGNRPIIPFINGRRLREQARDNDGVHAVVAAGYGENSEEDIVAIHDPWGHPEDIVPREKLEDAWDPMFNQVIRVSLSRAGQKACGDHQ